MESLLPGEAESPYLASQPQIAYRQIEQELLSLFTPDLLRDLLSEVPGMSLFAVKGALLFVGEKADLYIMHTKERGPFFVDSETVRAAFKQAASDSGILPPGVIRFGTGLSGEQWMVVHIPPARYTLSLVGFEPTLVRINIPLPGFVFVGVMNRYHVWAVKEPVMREETVVYHAPLPNVSPDTGGICWGGVSVPSVSNATIHQAFQLFMESLFNGHQIADRSHTYPQDVRLLLYELAQSKRRAYPFEDLLPFTNGGTVFTLRDALQSVLSRSIR